MYKLLSLFVAMAVATVASADEPRSLSLQGAPNFRDVGGYAAAGGRHVKWHVLYRSDELSKLTTLDADKVDALHIVSVVDLRTEEERRQAPSIWTHPPVDLYLSPQPTLAPFMRAILSDAPTAAGAKSGMIDFYSRLPDLYRSEYSALFHRIAAGTLPILIHCTAGKDRTGVAVALLLTQLGVAQQTVLNDYQLTEVFMPAADTAARGNAPVGVSAQSVLAQLPEESRRALWRSDPEYVQAALDSVNREYGSIDGYLLRRLNLSDLEIRSLRTALLE